MEMEVIGKLRQLMQNWFVTFNLIPNNNRPSGEQIPHPDSLSGYSANCTNFFLFKNSVNSKLKTSKKSFLCWVKFNQFESTNTEELNIFYRRIMSAQEKKRNRLVRWTRPSWATLNVIQKCRRCLYNSSGRVGYLKRLSLTLCLSLCSDSWSVACDAGTIYLSFGRRIVAQLPGAKLNQLTPIKIMRT